MVTHTKNFLSVSMLFNLEIFNNLILIQINTTKGSHNCHLVTILLVHKVFWGKKNIFAVDRFIANVIETNVANV